MKGEKDITYSVGIKEIIFTKTKQNKEGIQRMTDSNMKS